MNKYSIKKYSKKNKKTKKNVNKNFRVRKIVGGSLEYPSSNLSHNSKQELFNLISELKNKNSEMTDFIIKNNNIGVEEAKALSEALKYKYSEITHLIISNNNIGDEGVEALAKALIFEKSHKHPIVIDTLDISRNNIGNNGAIALTEALETYKTLTDLNIMYNNNIDGFPLRNLAKALKQNRQNRQKIQKRQGIDLGSITSNTNA